MFSPYEELEYLSDYLPEEGEAVLVVRESGELICKPWNQSDLRDGIHDSQLYGMLVQANERLNAVGSTPLWVAGFALIWLAIIVHGVLGIGWDRWYLVPGCSIPILYAALFWTKKRQQAYFQNAILPMLQTELRNRQTPFYSLVAGIRQHEEFRCLLDEIVHWSPQKSEL